MIVVWWSGPWEWAASCALFSCGAAVFKQRHPKTANWKTKISTAQASLAFIINSMQPKNLVHKDCIKQMSFKTRI